MLKLINFEKDGTCMHMDVLIEGDEKLRYQMCVDMEDPMRHVISSNIPDEYKIYERQARVALRRYIGKKLPETVTSVWY